MSGPPATAATLQMMDKGSITAEIFQEICDQAVLAVAQQGWPADALPDNVAGALIEEIYERVCHHIGKDDKGKLRLVGANERGIEEIVELVFKNQSGVILIEATIKEAERMVLEHWRARHRIQATKVGEGEVGTADRKKGSKR